MFICLIPYHEYFQSNMIDISPQNRLQVGGCKLQGIANVGKYIYIETNQEKERKVNLLKLQYSDDTSPIFSEYFKIIFNFYVDSNNLVHKECLHIGTEPCLKQRAHVQILDRQQKHILISGYGNNGFCEDCNENSLNTCI